MGCERVDYYSEDEYQQALQEEERFSEQEPNVVPCFKCGCQMYQEFDEPIENICSDCRPRQTTTEEINF